MSDKEEIMAMCVPEVADDKAEEPSKRIPPVPCTCICASNRGDLAAAQEDDDDAYAELFQRSLFATYDINVAFERRANHLDRLIATSGFEDDGSTLVERLKLSATLCPLQIQLEERSVEVTRSGSMEGTGEPVYQFVYRIPYEGDTELWYLTPVSAPIAPDESQPTGEIYRQWLILVFYAFNTEEAEQWLSRTIHSVQYVLEAQAREVAAFNGSLRDLIWRKLIKHRAGCELAPTGGTRTIH